MSNRRIPIAERPRLNLISRVRERAMYVSEPDPEHTYEAYQKFLKKQQYPKAYRCLGRLLKTFPDDLGLMSEMVALCLDQMQNPGLARPWLLGKIQRAPIWSDFAHLSAVEARLGNSPQAKASLARATALRRAQPWLVPPGGRGGDLLVHARDVLKLQEYNQWARSTQAQTDGRTVDTRRQAIARARRPPTPPSVTPVAPPPVAAPPILPLPTYTIPIGFEPAKPVMAALDAPAPLVDCRLRIEYAVLEIQRTFDELLCLETMTGIERYWYQIETVKKVLKSFHGRVLLCDEVGLGKTIEAAMLIKEYLLRGMAKTVLILTPATLVSQWKDEMRSKCAIECVTTEDPIAQTDLEALWAQPFVIASIHTAKTSRHFQRVADAGFDLVVVDEAHHLKNRKTLAWQLVNAIKKRFIFLLTATPVQNHLLELFNLITLLKPGQFKTERAFKTEYMTRDDPRTPKNKDRLRDLLREVMIRNTRSVIDLKLPKRYVSTIRLSPSDAERAIYDGVTTFTREHARSLTAPQIQLLLREAGSSPAALRGTLLRLASKYTDVVAPIVAAIDGLPDTSKGKALIDLVAKQPSEKKVIFAQYLKSVDEIVARLREHGVPYVTFRGDMTAPEKDDAIRRFQDAVPVLVSTESGGEGRNLQFCNTLINFDLPWNPMRIEQRIGRLHRIGQRRDVFIFNLSVRDTLEDHVLHVLESKINMFEMVIGEIEPILGYLGEDREFEALIMDIWLGSRSKDDVRTGFERLGNQLVSAKAEYLKSTVLDREIFGKDYEL